MNNTFINEIYPLAKKLELGNRLDLLDDVAAAYGFKDLLDFYKENSKNRDNQNCYHNNTHTFLTVMNALEGCLNMDNYITQNETKQVLIAALFHDFNHSQGKNTEDQNVYLALTGFEKAVEKTGFKDNTDKIKQLIKRSVFPRMKVIKECMMSGILCDADMMSIYNKDHNVAMICGLYKETKHLYNNVEDFVNKQRDFVRLNKWYTRWGSLKVNVHNLPLLHKQVLEKVSSYAV